MYIPRYLEQPIQHNLWKGKAIVLFGPRQTGKTTLVKTLIQQKQMDAVFLSGDDDFDVQLFETVRYQVWDQILGNKKTVFIDGAQRIPNIGRSVKLLLDNRQDVQVFITGSSSFQLANVTEEPLTGRKYEYRLFPFTFAELTSFSTMAEEQKQLENRLIYGSYPQIVQDKENTKENLVMLSDSYLYRDLLSYDGIRKPKLLQDLLKALAHQVGSEVSIIELSNLLQVARGTVESYLTLLEQAYIIFPLQAYTTNQRNEIKKGRKYYFWDVGIRNAIIRAFEPIASRNDIGALWENYLVAERRKLLQYAGEGEQYYWRTSDQMEVDYVEKTSKGLKAMEFKWNEGKQSRITRAFTNRYPDANLTTITRQTYPSFLQNLEG